MSAKFQSGCLRGRGLASLMMAQGGRPDYSTNSNDVDYAAYIPLLAFVAVLLVVFLLSHPSSTIMGALCGKQSNAPFSSPGRTLDAAPPAATTSSVPASAKKPTGPARTLGSNASPAAAAGQAEARMQAALAAEVRDFSFLWCPNLRN